MFLCEPCHAARCEWVHFVTSFGPCEVCKQRTVCWDCQKRAAGSEAQGTERRDSGGSGFDSRDAKPLHEALDTHIAKITAILPQQ